MPRDPVMQKAHEALVKDGWAEFPGDTYLKASGLQPGLFLRLQAVPEQCWELSLIGKEGSIYTAVARFEHLPEAAAHLTWIRN